MLYYNLKMFKVTKSLKYAAKVRSLSNSGVHSVEGFFMLGLDKKKILDSIVDTTPRFIIILFFCTPRKTTNCLLASC